MIGWVIKKILGTQNQREVKRLLPLVEEAKRQGEALRSLSIEQLRAKTPLFRERLAKGETLDQLLPEAFATVVALCRRLTEEKRKIRVRGQEMKWEMVPFDVQLIGGIVLHSGRARGDGYGGRQNIGGDFADISERLGGKRGACGDGERLSGGTGCGVDGGGLSGVGVDGGMSSAWADPSGAAGAVCL